MGKRLRVFWGATRLVVVTRRWAVKMPRPTEWRLFLHGLLCNMQERSFSTLRDVRMCPVKFALPGGWLVVMPAARALTDGEWSDLVADKFSRFIGDDVDVLVPVEPKRDSFGVVDGRVVAIDYGS